MAVSVLSLVGLLISLYLLAHSLGLTGPVMCGVGDCEAVQSSPYSYLGPVPISGIGAVGYVLLLVLAFFVGNGLVDTAFAVLFPGTASMWIRVLPSYPLVEGLVRVATYGDGWSRAVGHLASLLAWCVGLFAVGWIVLKRKVETL